MPKKSAGLLMYRFKGRGLEIFLVHPGGPFWRRKDAGAWSIPKGECLPAEPPLNAARREFFEETGIEPHGPYRELVPLRQKSGKTISAWAFEGDCDAQGVTSNTFTMEWPPHTGLQAEFPEVDKAQWFTINEGRVKILKGQEGFIDQLLALLGHAPTPGAGKE